MIGAFKSHDMDIANNATDGVHKKIERKWTATLSTQQIIRACNCGCCSFILNVAEDTWVYRLCDPD